MPAATYPHQITFYSFCRTIHPWFETGSLDYLRWRHKRLSDVAEATARAQQIESMRKGDDDDFPEAEDDAQYKLAEVLEAWLAKHALNSAKIVISFDLSDCMGNRCPYDFEPVSEPLYNGINLYQEMSPMYYTVFEGAAALVQRAAWRQLGTHRYFEDEQPKFAAIDAVFSPPELNWQPGDWCVVALLRSYSLHGAY